MKRGDILIVDFSVYNPQDEVRPASRCSRMSEPTQFLLDRRIPTTPHQACTRSPL